MTFNANLPLVTIVTPTLNQANFIEDTIDSIFSQTYKNIEYIIVDGGSTDQTHLILRKNKFLKGKYFIKKDLKQTASINFGWKNGRGDIFAYLNSDDTYYDKFVVEKIVEKFQLDQNIDLLYGNAMYIDEVGRPIRPYNTYEFDYVSVAQKWGNPIPQPSAFIHKRVIKKFGYLDESFDCAMDYEYWMRIGKESNFFYLNSYLSNFRLHQKAKSSQMYLKMANDIKNIYSKYFLNNKSYTKKEILKISQSCNLELARLYFKGKKFKKSKKFYLAILLKNPIKLNMKDLLKLFVSSTKIFKLN